MLKILLREIGYSKKDINRLNFELKNISIEGHEDFLSYIENQEESITGKILKK